MTATETFRTLTFREAAPIWLDSRSRLGPGTKGQYEQYIKILNEFFGELPLEEIEIGNIKQYREDRIHARFSGRRKTGASRINHEVNTLQQIMTRAGCWTKIADWYEPLPVPRPKVGMALTAEEEQHLFRVASSRKKWLVAYCCSLLTANTTAGPGEIRKLQLQDIRVASEPTIYVREGAKNEGRVREIELNDDALWAVQELLERAHDRGSYLPDHYLLPHRANHSGAKPDPSTPMGSWKKAWYSLRSEAAKQHPRLARLRMYDLRHHAGTKLLENPNVSEQTAEAIFGHMSKRMKETYSHIRKQAKKEAVAALSGGYTPKRPVLSVVSANIKNVKDGS